MSNIFGKDKRKASSPLRLDIAGDHAVAKALQQGLVLSSISPAELQTAFPWLPTVSKANTQLTLPAMQTAKAR